MKTKSCGCSVQSSKSAEDMIRDIINMISVMKKDEVEDVTTRIEPKAAKELTAMLEKLAKKVGDVCSCN